MWEIYAYQNSDSLFGIFNAVAAMAGANTFKSALAIVAFCGFVAALVGYTFMPQKLQGWQWLGSVTLVLSILFMPRVTVGIVDKTGGSSVMVVDNVPFGLAVFGSLTSTVGNSMTELYETAMQVLPGTANLPAELTYEQNGLMFGHRLIRETRRVVFQDPNFRTDLINFVNNCTIYDLASGDISPEVFATSGDVWALMGAPNPARFSPVTDAGGKPTIAPCPDVYRILNGRLPTQVGRIQDLLAGRMNPTLPGTMAASLIAGQIQQAYLRNRIATAASTAADLIRQNALINSINDASIIVGQKINDPTSMLLAVGRAQAVAQTNSAWITGGKIAEQALPIIRNVVEAVTYASFPIVILLLLMTSGRDTVVGLKIYLGVLIWIQLWPPLYAILNYMAMVYGAREIAAAASIGGGASALALTNASSIYSTAISGEALVGWMTFSIPMIAWAGVKGAGTLGPALVSGLQTLQSTTNSASGSAASGNISMGNTAMDQVTLAPTRTSAFFSTRQDDVTGNTYSRNVLSGLTAVKALANEGPVSRIVDAKVTQQHVLAASKSVAEAQAETVAAQRDKAWTLASVLLSASSHVTGIANTTGTRSSSDQSIGERINQLKQVAKNISSLTGMSEGQVVSVAVGGTAYVSGGIPGAVKAFSPVDAGVQLSAKGGKDYSAAVQKQDQIINNALKSEDKAKFKSFADTFSRDTGLVRSVITDKRKGKELSERLAENVSRSTRTEENLRTQLQFAESVAGAYQRGETISKDIAKDPNNIKIFEKLLRHEQMGTGAELIKFDSFLGNMAIHPHPITKGTNLPNSFSDVEVESSNVRESERFSFDQKKLERQFENKANAPSDKRKPESLSNFNKETHSGADIRDFEARAVADFDQRFEKFSHGKVQDLSDKDELVSKKSLLEDVADQVKNDPDIVVEKSKKLLEKLREITKGK